MKPSLCLVFAGIATAYCAALPCAAQVTIDAQSTTVLLDRGLAISGISQVARRPINTDAVIAGVVDGTLDLGTVKAGDALVPGRSWSEIAAKEGSFAAPGRGAYVLIRVTSSDDRVMMLQASGHAMVYVNGQPRMGDPYSHGYVTLPIELRKGENTLLFAHAGRGGMKAELRSSAAELVILDGDLTLPDASRTRDIEAFVGVPLANASTRSRVVTLVTDAGNGPSESAPITLAPLGVLKASTQVKIPASTQARSLVLTVRESGQTVAQHTTTLNAPEIGSHYKITFQSRVDASTQYISIVPPKASDSSDTTRPALVLSLHGASVEATNQANSYAPRPGVLIACPTNRRPFGFDWEDWGRIDAIESMDEVIRRYNTDPARQYLTGHSMGGHGTWNIGALYPERFAAIAPSAGWLSFDTYTSRGGPEYAPPGPLGDTFRMARASSDTLTFFPNLRGKGVYILHGDKDDNVPVEQAREARKALDALNIPYQFHEQPGAGHWWDDDKPGAACLDWPGIWDLFAQHSLPSTPPAPAVTPPIDDRGFPRDAFKRVFDRDFVLVYATAGTPEENAWSLAKARYDAEQWWIRGNGQAVIMSDEAFTKSPTRGNVILYGHADSTKAWKQLVGEEAAVQITRGKAKVNGKLIEGETTAVLAALPRADVPGSEVGVITGTGLSGMRATDRLGYFGSGVGFPEVTVIEASIWKEGFTGVRGAGPKGQIVWRE
jgi:poly(3-hydroxybutyrate) depolymerase